MGKHLEYIMGALCDGDFGAYYQLLPLNQIGSLRNFRQREPINDLKISKQTSLVVVDKNGTLYMKATECDGSWIILSISLSLFDLIPEAKRLTMPPTDYIIAILVT